MPMPVPNAVPNAAPTIKLTLRQLLDAQPALQRLSSERLPVKLAYNVARLIKVLQPELDEFMKQRDELIKEHGTKRSTTDAEKAQHGDEIIEVMPAQMSMFRKQVDELTTVVVTVDRAPLKLDADNISISAADLLALEPLLEEM